MAAVTKERTFMARARTLWLLALILLHPALHAAAQVPYEQSDAAYDAQAMRATARAASLESAALERRARAEERARKFERIAAAQAEARPMLSIGFAPSMLSQRLNNSRTGHFDTQRLRQRTVEIGLGVAKHYARNLGIRAFLSAGVGATSAGYGEDLEDALSCCTDSRRIRPSYSLALDVAPVIGAGSSNFYLAPGAVLRMFILPQRRADVEAEDWYGSTSETPTVHTVSFHNPAVAVAARIAGGVRLGPHHEVDLGWGFDVGGSMRDLGRYLALSLRAAVAFTDLSSLQ
jgi:hypothetical protein